MAKANAVWLPTVNLCGPHAAHGRQL